MMKNFAVGLVAGTVIGLGVGLATHSAGCHDMKRLKRKTCCTMKNLGRVLHRFV